MADQDQRVCIGKITSVHGIQGAVKIRAYTENPSNITKYGEITNADGSKVFDLKVRVVKQETVVATIKGVDTRNDAEILRGTKLYILRQNLPSLYAEEHFYVDELVGLDVYHAVSEALYGEVIGVYNYGASDIVEIRSADTGNEEMFVFTHDVVPEVNIEEGYIVIDPPDVEFVSDNDNDDQAGAL